MRKETAAANVCNKYVAYVLSLPLFFSVLHLNRMISDRFRQ